MVLPPRTISLTPSCIDSLMSGEDEPEPDLNHCLVAAVAYFLDQEGTDAAGYAYPKFRRDGGEGPTQELELTIDEGLWSRFAAEAERQQVTPAQLLEHAALYFAAQRDAGGLAQRIARGLCK
jgi:hypothetical protein